MRRNEGCNTHDFPRGTSICPGNEYEYGLCAFCTYMALHAWAPGLGALTTEIKIRPSSSQVERSEP